MTDQLTGRNEIAPITVDYTEIQKFCRGYVCSICRSHPQAMPTDDRNTYEIHCLVCGVPIITGGYVSVYDLRQLEEDEFETRVDLRQPKNDPDFDAEKCIKELGL